MIRSILLAIICAGLVANGVLLALTFIAAKDRASIECGAPPCEALCQAEQALDYALPFETPMPELLARFELAGFEIQGLLEALDGVTMFVLTEAGAHPSDVEIVVTLEFDPVEFTYLRGRVLHAQYDSLFADLGGE